MQKRFILALSGSLREGSTNTALLEAVKLLAPQHVEIQVWNGQGELTQFTPDKELFPPQEVQDFRTLLGRTDGLIIACPEYVRGIPGSFKNALDWLVGGDTFVNKPFALWNASPRAHHAQDSLRLVLETMSGRCVEEAALDMPLIKLPVTAQHIAAHPELRLKIETALAKFVQALDADTVVLR